jgi:hypothetical protein
VDGVIAPVVLLIVRPAGLEENPKLKNRINNGNELLPKLIFKKNG